MKLAASEAFKGKKTCYEGSVPEPFMYSRLGMTHFFLAEVPELGIV